ncbi:MAG: alpha/beta hydrolase fold domain-containing protein [Chromatiales bacterium]|nr:alpha/beta hydrolase fold domain-containing protein [Chromatiales bacterium]
MAGAVHTRAADEQQCCIAGTSAGGVIHHVEAPLQRQLSDQGCRFALLTRPVSGSGLAAGNKCADHERQGQSLHWPYDALEAAAIKVAAPHPAPGAGAPLRPAARSPRPSGCVPC